MLPRNLLPFGLHMPSFVSQSLQDSFQTLCHPNTLSSAHSLTYVQPKYLTFCQKKLNEPKALYYISVM